MKIIGKLFLTVILFFILAHGRVATAVFASQSDPGLSKLLSLAFSGQTNTPETQEQNDEEFFAPIFVDKTDGKVHRSVSVDKTRPIGPDDMVGISSFFSRFHPGHDYRAKVGTPVLAILPGVVNEIGFERGGYGKYVVLIHHLDGKTIFSLYAHLKSVPVVVGQELKSGETLGTVGMTGRTTGPHLHFEIHDSTRSIDPMVFFGHTTLAIAIK